MNLTSIHLTRSLPSLISQSLPNLGHLQELFAMAWQRNAGDVAALQGEALEVFRWSHVTQNIGNRGVAAKKAASRGGLFTCQLSDRAA